MISIKLKINNIYRIVREKEYATGKYLKVIKFLGIPIFKKEEDYEHKVVEDKEFKKTGF